MGQALFADDNVNGHIGLTSLRARIDPNGSFASEVNSLVSAKAINPNILLWGTEWSPPAQYKANNNVNGGTSNDTFLGAESGSPNSADTGYASYLVSFIQYAQSKGVNLYAVSVQNEPNFNPTYEACLWTAGQFHVFIQAFHNALQSAGLSTKIMFPEPDNTYGMNLASTTMNDATTAAYVSIIGTHLYGTTNPGTLSSYGYTHVTNQEFWETEMSGNTTDMPGALQEAGWIQNSLVGAGMNSFHYWWLQDLISNNSLDIKAFVLGNYSKFIRPGYYRMGATASPTSGVSISAFKDTNNSSPSKIVFVAINNNGSATSQTFSLNGLNVTSVTPWLTDNSHGLIAQSAIAVSGNSFTYSLPASSVVSFVATNNAGSTSTATNSPTKTNTPIVVTNTNTPIVATNTNTPIVPTNTFTPIVTVPTQAATLTTTGANPLIYQKYTADPTACFFNGRMYIYCSHDKDGATGYSINDVTLMSSDDLANWKDEGETAKASGWAGLTYAPDTVYRNGYYYMYYGNGGGSIGVLKSTSPTGPWTDPLGHAMIDSSTPGCSGMTYIFDPAAFVDDDGQAYMYFGGGGVGNARVIKVNSDMISVNGSAVTIDAPRYFEAPFINKVNGTYYFSYCTDFSASPAASIDYMTSSNPMTGFTHRGTILNNPSDNCGNNSHASIVNMNGSWYIAYHTRRLMSINEGNCNNIYERSVCLDKLKFNTDGTIAVVTTTTTGVNQLKYFNPYGVNEAETMNTESGIKTEVCSEGGLDVTNIQNGGWIKISKVDFGTGATTFDARVASATSGGNIELRLDSATGTLIGTCAIVGTGGTQTWQTKSCAVSGATGVHDLYLKFTGASGLLFNLNWYRFNKNTNVTPTFTATSTPCAATAITPYIQVNGGTWQQTSVVSVTSTGSVINLGPQPVTGGAWTWSGTNGFTASSREILSIPLIAGANVFTAVYTNDCGAKSTQVFTITVSIPTATNTPVTPSPTPTTPVPTNTPVTPSPTPTTPVPTNTPVTPSPIPTTPVSTNTPVTPSPTPTTPVPTNTFTKTFTPIPPTSTPIPPTATPTTSVKVQLTINTKSADINNNSTSPHPQIQVKNSGTTALNLNNIEVRYWLNCDCSGQSVQAIIDYAGKMPQGTSIGSNAGISVVSTNIGGQTSYLSFKFTGSIILQPNEYVEVQARFNKSDWSAMNQSNDWSYTGSQNWQASNKTTAYAGGSLVWGQEPASTQLSVVVSNVITYPNPATSATGATLSYTIATTSSGTTAQGANETIYSPDPSDKIYLKIFSAANRLIWQKELDGICNISTGTHSIKWDAKAPGGQELGLGTYTLKVELKEKNGVSTGFSRIIMFK
jgi:arabinoxylan arabinofuranohydrolase